jgi:hypothetical protein
MTTVLNTGTLVFERVDHGSVRLTALIQDNYIASVLIKGVISYVPCDEKGANSTKPVDSPVISMTCIRHVYKVLDFESSFCDTLFGFENKHLMLPSDYVMVEKEDGIFTGEVFMNFTRDLSFTSDTLDMSLLKGISPGFKIIQSGCSIV